MPQRGSKGVRWAADDLLVAIRELGLCPWRHLGTWTKWPDCRSRSRITVGGVAFRPLKNAQTAAPVAAQDVRRAIHGLWVWPAMSLRAGRGPS
jgi:hypothetical protein